jgi:hypothetical protein
LRQERYDAVSAAALLRLVASWLPPRLDEVFLDETGAAANEALIAWCRQEKYDNETDVSLAAERSAALVRLFGKSNWETACLRVGEKALAAVEALPEVVHEQRAALVGAQRHFAMMEARVRLRAGTMERSEALDAALQAERCLVKFVEEILQRPWRRIDAIGLYVLSQEQDVLGEEKSFDS